MKIDYNRYDLYLLRYLLSDVKVCALKIKRKRKSLNFINFSFDESIFQKSFIFNYLEKSRIAKNMKETGMRCLQFIFKKMSTNQK